MSFKELSRCLACGQTSLERYISFGRVVPANTYVDSYSATTDLYRAPLEVNFCTSCSHSQLSGIVAPEILYKDYLYVSGTTQKLKDHFKSLVTSSLPMKPMDKISVLDIGANDLSLLEEFKSRGVQVEGVDPAENLYELSKHKNIPVLVDFWDSNSAYRVTQAPFDLITGLNVFAHNPDPMDFLLGCRRVLKQGGRVLIELPGYKQTIQGRKFTQIYHEHINYFSVQSMGRLSERVNMFIAEVTEFPDIHDGTLRFILEVGLNAHCQRARDMIFAEGLAGMQEFSTYLDFKESITTIGEDLSTLLTRYKKDGRKVVAFGASAKLSTLLEVLSKEGKESINYIVDNNPLKVGKYQVDSDIRIFPVDKLLEEVNPAILITPDNFFEEIKSRLKSLGVSGELIRYVPSVSKEVLL